MMAAPDYYAQARQIASRIAEEGFGDWAKRIETAIADGFTATEILMGLRWQLKELHEAGLPLTTSTKYELEQFLDELGKILS